MRRMLTCAVLCVVTSAFAASILWAFPSYAKATGKPCGFCHIDPGGGGF